LETIDDKTVKGENNSTYEEFRNDHVYSWEEDLRKEGIRLDDSTMIVVEHFRLNDWGQEAGGCLSLLSWWYHGI
jgi:uncharacterized protein YhfF